MDRNKEPSIQNTTSGDVKDISPRLPVFDKASSAIRVLLPSIIMGFGIATWIARFFFIPTSLITISTGFIIAIPTIFIKVYYEHSQYKKLSSKLHQSQNNSKISNSHLLLLSFILFSSFLTDFLGFISLFQVLATTVFPISYLITNGKILISAFIYAGYVHSHHRFENRYEFYKTLSSVVTKKRKVNFKPLIIASVIYMGTNIIMALIQIAPIVTVCLLSITTLISALFSKEFLKVSYAVYTSYLLHNSMKCMHSIILSNIGAFNINPSVFSVLPPLFSAAIVIQLTTVFTRDQELRDYVNNTKAASP